MIDPGAREEINDAISAVARFANSRRLAAVHSAQSGIDLPMSAVAVLRQLNAGLPLRLSELARRLQIALPPLSRLVRGLETDEFLQRTPDGKDARASLLTITPAGCGALHRFDAANHVLLDQALEGWTDDEVTAVAAAMQRLIRDLRRGGPGGPAEREPVG